MSFLPDCVMWQRCCSPACQLQTDSLKCQAFQHRLLHSLKGHPDWFHSGSNCPCFPLCSLFPSSQHAGPILSLPVKLWEARLIPVKAPPLFTLLPIGWVNYDVAIFARQLYGCSPYSVRVWEWNLAGKRMFCSGDQIIWGILEVREGIYCWSQTCEDP